MNEGETAEVEEEVHDSNIAHLASQEADDSISGVSSLVTLELTGEVQELRVLLLSGRAPRPLVGTKYPPCG